MKLGIDAPTRIEPEHSRPQDDPPMYEPSLTLATFDPELAAAVLREERRQEDHAELIASVGMLGYVQLVGKYPGKP